MDEKRKNLKGGIMPYVNRFYFMVCSSRARYGALWVTALIVVVCVALAVPDGLGWAIGNSAFAGLVGLFLARMDGVRQEYIHLMRGD